MFKNYFTIIVISLASVFAAQAQEWDWATSANYSVGIPTGDLKEFTDNVSGRGFIFEARRFLSNQASVGFSVGWQVYKDRLEGTFSEEGIDATGTQVRYVNTLPIMVTGHYYLGSPGSIRPYLGGGVGTTHSLQRTDLGLFSDNNNNWHFGFYPEVGVYIPLAFDMGLNLAAKYNYAIATSESIDYSYLAFSVGFAWLR